MELAAESLPPLELDGPPVELHVLTGHRFWYQTAFCLWSFSRTSGRLVAPVVYDDGTLRPRERDHLERIFPKTRIITVEENLARAEQHLPASRFPAIRERLRHYPNLRKVTDVHAGQSGWKLVVDSDLLFFNSPRLLVEWVDSPDRPLHAVDVATAYGYSRSRMESLTGVPISERINVGLTGLRSDAIDWDRFEFWCRSLIENEGPHYFLEQALVAMLVAGQECAIAPEHEYVTFPQRPEATACRAVMHHYVQESKRWYFQHNWRRVLQAAS
jgi:hypothetical protein